MKKGLLENKVEVEHILSPTEEERNLGNRGIRGSLMWRSQATKGMVKYNFMVVEKIKPDPDKKCFASKRHLQIIVAPQNAPKNK